MKLPKENLKEKVFSGWSLGSINISRLGRECLKNNQRERRISGSGVLKAHSKFPEGLQKVKSDDSSRILSTSLEKLGHRCSKP